VRQPLREMIVSAPAKQLEKLEDYVEIIRGELNVKAVRPLPPDSELSEYHTRSAKLNFKLAGPRLGKDVKRAAEQVAGLSKDGIEEFQAEGKLDLAIGDSKIVLSGEEIEIMTDDAPGYAFESDRGVAVVLNTELDDELLDEGFARELVNKIQNMRKTSGLEVTDRIRVTLDSTERVKSAARRHDEFIRSETLADRLEFAGIESGEAREWNINGERTSISVVKV
jgi:isoleucyl-tRNA synthetase